MPEANPNAPPGQPAQGMSSTTKWVIGCLGAVLLVGALACGGFALIGWWGYAKIKEYTVAMQKYGDNIQGKGDVGVLYAQARAAAPFDEAKPADLTERRFATYLTIRDAMKPAVEKHKAQIKIVGGNGRPGADLGAIIALLEAWNEIKVEHAKLLAREKMSPEEYTHISRQVYGALLTENIAAPEELSGVTAPDAKTAAIIQPHLAELKADSWTSVDALLLGTDLGKYQPKNRSKGGSDGD